MTAAATTHNDLTLARHTQTSKKANLRKPLPFELKRQFPAYLLRTASFPNGPQKPQLTSHKPPGVSSFRCPRNRPIKSSFDSASLRDASLRMTAFWDGWESNPRSGVQPMPSVTKRCYFVRLFRHTGSPIVPTADPSVTTCNTSGASARSRTGHAFQHALAPRRCKI
jgi:hypothetical protein